MQREPSQRRYNDLNPKNGDFTFPSRARTTSRAAAPASEEQPASFISHSNSNSTASARSVGSCGSRDRHPSSANASQHSSPWNRDRDLPPLPSESTTSTFETSTPRRPAHRPTTSGGSASQLPHMNGTRNFSRPSPAVRSIDLQPSPTAATRSNTSGANKDLGYDVDSDDASSSLPSLSLSSARGSDSPAAYSPATPLREVLNQQTPPPRPAHAGRNARPPKDPALGETGMVGRLRHAASTSSLGRGLSRRAPTNTADVPAEDSFLPSLARNAIITAESSGAAMQASRTENVDEISITNQRTGTGLLRGRKSSFGDLRKGDKGSSRDDKRSKPSFWTSLRRKDREEPASAPASSSTFYDTGRASPSTRLMGSKADRLLGHDENERRDLMEKKEKQRQADHLRAAKARDVLADFCLDWDANGKHVTNDKDSNAPAGLENIVSWRSQHRSGPSTSSVDSFVTSVTGTSRVSERAPTLDSPIGMPSRELSDDIEAVLRSQRDSVKGVEDLLNTHRAMVSMMPQVSHRPSDSVLSSEVSSIQEEKSFFPSSRAGHTADSSVSSAYTSSTRSRSTSITSGSGPSLRWADESKSVLQMPRRSKPTTHVCEGTHDGKQNGTVPDASAPAVLNDAPPHQRGQFEDAEEEPVSPHPFAAPVLPYQDKKRRPLLRTANTHDVSASPALLSAKTTHVSMQKTISEPPSTDSRRPMVQERAAAALRVLPPLISLQNACLVASQLAWKGPWSEVQGERLTESAPKDKVPLAWAAYLRAYARGDFDISSPPRPRIDLASTTRTAEALHAQSLGIALDVDFPLPPAREAGRTPTQARNDSSSLHSRNASTLSAAFRATETSLSEPGEKSLGQEGPTPTPMAPGNLKAPRPPFESERLHATQRYLCALGLDSSDRHVAVDQFRNIKLSSVAETLRSLLQVTKVCIQLVGDDEVITLVKSGQTPSEDAEAVRTPRASERGALGLHLFDQPSVHGSVAVRDDSFEAHVLLNKDGSPVVLDDIQRDWRFAARDTHCLSFYAAASLLSSDGLPIGAVSVYDTVSRPGGLARDETSHLVKATQRVMEELELIRQTALHNRLVLLDDSLKCWATKDHEETTLTHKKSGSLVPASIEGTLLSAPSRAGANGTKAPLSPNTLAKRRGAKVPANLTLSHHSNFVGPQQSHMALLSAALRTITSTLKVDLAYIAQVRPTGGAVCAQSLNASCTVIVRCDAGHERPAELHLDGPLHMCALAATKRGLHLQQDSARVAQLLGVSIDSADSASWGQESSSFYTAAVLNCGLKEAGKTWQDSQGWVLGVASQDPSARIAPENTIYLLRFASLLAPILLDDSRSPQTSGSLKSPKTRARCSSNPTRAFSPRSPLSPRSRGASPAGAKRVLPPLSPPPTEPLPLLPTGPSPLQTPRPLVPMDRSVSSDATPRLPSHLQRPPHLRRAASSATSGGAAIPAASMSTAEVKGNGAHDAVEYVTSAVEDGSESETSGYFVETRAGAGTPSASFLRIGSMGRRSHDLLRNTAVPHHVQHHHVSRSLPDAKQSSQGPRSPPPTRSPAGAQPSPATYESILPSFNDSSGETSSASLADSSTASSPISTRSRLLPS